MKNTHSDSLVFFGVTGDLAYKQIFPALQAMIRRGQLDMPIIGVAGRPWSIEQLRSHVHDSLKEHGDVDSGITRSRAGTQELLALSPLKRNLERNHLGAWKGFPSPLSQAR